MSFRTNSTWWSIGGSRIWRCSLSFILLDEICDFAFSDCEIPLRNSVVIPCCLEEVFEQVYIRVDLSEYMPEGGRAVVIGSTAKYRVLSAYNTTFFFAFLRESSKSCFDLVDLAFVGATVDGDVPAGRVFRVVEVITELHCLACDHSIYLLIFKREFLRQLLHWICHIELHCDLHHRSHVLFLHISLALREKV